jgi:glycosyltransferase involved in cell wall biosynthesis
MKILLLSFWFYDYTIQLANALSKRETVMLMLPDHVSQDFLKNLNEDVILYLFDQPTKLYNPLNLLTIYEIVAQINKFNPDIVHYQINNIMICPLFSLLKRYPLIGTFHDIKPHLGEERLYSMLTKFALNYAAGRSQHIFVHGKWLKNCMQSEYGIASEKVHAIPLAEHNVALFEQYRRSDLKEQCNSVLFFGRIWRYKGLDYLIQAEPLITNRIPNAKIIIAGKGENFKRYEDLMVNKNNFNLYIDNISYQKGAELFQRSSVVVLPYIDASQSGIIPLAYSFKKPVVVTDVGSIPESVDDGVTGFIVPPKDPAALAEAILKLLEDEKLRRTMGENGYRKLKSELSIDIAAKEILKVYIKALEITKGSSQKRIL